MKLRDLPFEGHYEENDARTHQVLQIVMAENGLERNLLCESILRHPMTVTDDESRRDYVFHYDLLGPMHGGANGLYRLRLVTRDSSNNSLRAHIAAGLVATLGGPEGGRTLRFAPHWFISKRLGFESDNNYHGPVFGRLAFGDPGMLPHRRLFGATV